MSLQSVQAWAAKRQPCGALDLNLSNPLTRKIDVAWSAHRSFDRGCKRGFASLHQAATPAVGFAGVARTFSGSVSVEFPGGHSGTGADVTLSVIYKPSSIPADVRIFGIGASSDTGFYFWVDLGRLGFVKPGVAANFSATTTLTAGETYFLSISYAAGTMNILMRNLRTGVITTTSLGEATAWAASDGVYSIGNQRFNGTAGAPGDYTLAIAHARALTTSEQRQLALNPWQIFRQGQPLARPRVGGAASVDLAGNASAQATSTAALSLLKSLAGAAQGLASASGSMGLGVTLAGAATGSGSASGAVSVGKLLAAAALGQGSASGAMAQAVALAAAAVAQGSAAGTLTHGVPLGGAAAGAGSAGAQLALSVLLSGAASGAASASGSLSTSSGLTLAGNAVGSAGAAGSLALQVSLAGASLGSGSVGGSLNKVASLNGAAVGMATGTGQIALSIALAGAAIASASAGGTLNGAVSLSGAAAAQAGATGLLSLSVPVTAAAIGRAQAGGGLVLTVILGGSAMSVASASGGLAIQSQVLLSGAAGGASLVTGSLSLLSETAVYKRAVRIYSRPRNWRAGSPGRNWRIS